jgi:hypothetical protein
MSLAMGTMEPVEAGPAEDREQAFELALGWELPPSAESMLWAHIGDALVAISGLREQGARKNEQKLIEHAERVQALYLLLIAGNFGVVRLCAQFDFMCAQLAELEWFRGREIEPPANTQERLRVQQLAQEIAKKLRRELAQGNETPPAHALPGVVLAPLPEEAAAKMREGFLEVRYAKGTRSVFLEPDFARQMILSWDRPLLATTAHAVETLHELARREWALLQIKPGQDRASLRAESAPHFRVEPEVIGFLRSRHQNDRFVDLPEKPEEPRQDLYATSAGIAVFKAARDIACNQRPSAEQLSALFQSEGESDEPISHVAMREYALSSLSWMLARANQRWLQYAATLVEINHALRVIWNLSADAPGGFEALIDPYRSELRRFLKDSRTDAHDLVSADMFPSFGVSPTRKAACVTACLAALRIASFAGLLAGDAELSGHLRACSAYVLRCESPGGGFGSSIGHQPDVLHTYMAITLLQEWAAPECDETMKARTVAFLSRCEKDGGYALVPEWKPTAYGTRLAFQIFRRLGLEWTSLPATEMQSFIRRLMMKTSNREEGYAGMPLPLGAGAN